MNDNPVDPVLLVAWLVLAHLVADFVLQNDWIAINKGGGSRSGWSALAVHGFHVALCLVPVALAFGVPGIVYVVIVALSHMAVDRWKVRATRIAADHAQSGARARLAKGDMGPTSGLGAAWTPWPGLLFLADQALHLAIALIGWLVILEGEALLPAFVDFVNAVIAGWDPVEVHAATLTAVVLVSLFLANTRGAYYFALALLSPRAIVLEPGEEPAPGPAPGPTAVAPASTAGRIEATVAAIERLLMVALVLAGSILGALIVGALDVAARWRRLADRDAAEAYLLGLVASMSVAIGTGLVAVAALASLA